MDPGGGENATEVSEAAEQAAPEPTDMFETALITELREPPHVPVLMTNYQ